jgi:hypothetical protein
MMIQNPYQSILLCSSHSLPFRGISSIFPAAAHCCLLSSPIVGYCRQPSANYFVDKRRGKSGIWATTSRNPPSSRPFPRPSRKAVGVTTAAVQAYEHGRAGVTVERLEDLARALQCEPVELLAPPGTALPRYRSQRI